MAELRRVDRRILDALLRAPAHWRMPPGAPVLVLHLAPLLTGRPTPQTVVEGLERLEQARLVRRVGRGWIATRKALAA